MKPKAKSEIRSYPWEHSKRYWLFREVRTEHELLQKSFVDGVIHTDVHMYIICMTACVASYTSSPLFCKADQIRDTES